MVKRSSKYIALLLAGMTSVYSIPVYAKVMELEGKDGEFSNAVAFNSGKYLYEGYKGDNDSAVYYNDGKTDLKLDDVDDLDDSIKYNDKYVIADDNDYRINIEDGTYTDDYIDIESSEELVKSKLNHKLRKTRRYGNDVNVEQVKNINNKNFTNDIWYSYVAEASDSYDDSIFEESNGENELEINILKEFASNEKLKIIGQIFDVKGNSEEDIDDLINQIKCTNFTDYVISKLSKVEIEGSKKYGIKFAVNPRSSEGILEKDDFRNNEIEYYGGSEWSQLEEDELSIKTQEDILAENTKTKIQVKVDCIWGDMTICGKTFGGVYRPADLKSQIDATAFDNYIVVSTELDESGSLIIIFGTEDELEEVPSEFVIGGDWSSGYAEVSLVNNETDAVALTYESNQTTGSGVTVQTASNESKLAKEDSEAAADDDDDEQTEGTAKYYGYYNEDGRYVDCSEISNLTIYNGKRIVKFEKFNTSKTVDGFTMKIGLPEFVDTLGQDENYIYSLIKVSILGAKKESDNSDINEPIYYVQKISKASSGKVDGANLPSSAESFQLDNRGWDGGDNWSYTAAYTRIIDKYVEDHDSVNIAFIDGEMYLGLAEDDKAVSVRIKLKRKAKGLLEDGTEVFEKMVSVDTSNETDEEPYDWTVDKNGNVWSIYKGKIQKSSQAGEFQDVYKVDRTMDRIDVYDDNNLVAWSTDTGIYTTVQEGETATKNVKKTGWQSIDGNWHLYDLSGNETKGWHKVGKSSWYYFNDEGIMQKGWLGLNGKAYYLSNSGIMKKGWVKIDEKWYYFNQAGEKQVNTTIDGYALNENGEWIG